MKASSNNHSRDCTNAKTLEVPPATKKKVTKAVFDGVVLPQKVMKTKPVEAKSVPVVSRAPIEKEA